ncbi:tudor domain-containing protein 7 [Cephus cinctus]|uniref:Tudor domain-containing protein 7 n=1 Tax=Cephus cinctus TaxID=211228 RepID=A0AAJ7FEK4_CEPCN|nr:tudor domain-containing protein 7 [Cephus cinctus]XP_015587927.1 tudor domain-containing protein 7 [Cephus cinctus]XP_024937216.1 tudor domain-containing protein 7 [Cephus cinctus]
MADATLDNVISTLRACLLSAKGGVSIHNLNKDYENLNGYKIPYRKLGYSTLEEFLRTVPGLKAVNKGGDLIIEAQPTKDSVHITDMIARQRTTSKKKPRRMAVSRYVPQRRPVPSSWVPPAMSQAISRSPRTNRQYQTFRNDRPPTGNLPSLMALPVKQPPPSPTVDKPRYLRSTSGTMPSSPSKQMWDRKTNTVLAQNQSLNKTKVTEPYPRIAPFVGEPLPHTGRPTGEPPRSVPKVRSNLSERLNVKPVAKKQPVLSPPQLSPVQVTTGLGNIQGVTSTSISLVQDDTNRKNFTHVGSHDPRDQLKALARTLNLSEPEYKLITATTKGKNDKFVKVPVYAQVKVGSSLKYSSYPNEAHTSEEAEKLAAVQAINDLTEKYGPFTGIAETKDKTLIKERVCAIIEAHPNGIFMHQVPVYYKQQHNENLPENWLRIIEECSSIMLDKGAHNSMILRRSVPYVDKVEEYTSKMDRIQLNPIGIAAPGTLQLPRENFWITFVTLVTGTVGIWAKLVGSDYSDKVATMASEMEQHYAHMKPNQSHIEVDNYYAIFEDESWHRVQCLEYDDQTGEATVLFIDLGDEDTFHYTKLFPLDKRFCTLPAQALRLCLAGLEEFAECESIVSVMEEHLVARTLHAQVLSRGTDREGPFATVILHDTQGPDDVNLNKVLFKLIMEHFANSSNFFNTEKQIAEVFVSHVEDNGDVYVQTKSESLTYLVHLLNRLNSTGLSQDDVKKSSVSVIDTTKLYYGQSIKDGNWYRAKVIDIASQPLKMFLVDFGKITTVARKNLLSLEKLSDVLAKFPYQAVKVRLSTLQNSKLTEKMVARLIELAPHTEPLLAKVVRPGNRGLPPLVELFKRIQPDNILISINNTLALEPELLRTDGDGNNNNTHSRKRVERSISRNITNGDVDAPKSLKPPEISDIGGYYDVHVTMAAHPGNFTVQPFNDMINLQAMMVQLQERCSKYQGSPMTRETVKEGRLYAAKHIDGHWYRVCISNIINEQIVTVYFCDFGDVSVLTLDKILPLTREFLELPYQAIRARLVGIKPTNIDWSVEDCLRFQQLVVDRDFVSIVTESGPDRLSPADTVLGLRLIDVSSDEDIFIDELLVDEGRALFINQPEA